MKKKALSTYKVINSESSCFPWYLTIFRSFLLLRGGGKGAKQRPPTPPNPATWKLLTERFRAKKKSCPLTDGRTELHHSRLAGLSSGLINALWWLRRIKWKCMISNPNPKWYPVQVKLGSGVVVLLVFEGVGVGWGKETKIRMWKKHPKLSWNSEKISLKL